MKRVMIPLLALSILLTLAMPAIAEAGLTWTGQGDQKSWDDARNWSPREVPKDDDEVSIGFPGVPGAVELNDNRTVGSLNLSAGGYIVGRKEVGGRSIMTHRLSISSRLTWTGGDINSHVTLQAGSSSRVSGLETKNLGQDATLVNRGRLTFASDARVVNLWHRSNLNNTKASTLVLEHGALLNGEDGQITNQGTLRVFRPLLPALSQSATLQDMTVAFLGHDPWVQTSGTVQVESGVLELVSGLHHIAAAARFTGPGKTRLSEGTSTPDGTATLHGPVNLTGGRFELARGGHLAGTGSFVGGGVFRWTGGVIEGTVTIPRKQAPKNRLVITGPDEKHLTTLPPPAIGGKLVNRGTATFEGSGKLVMSSDAVLENAGTLTIKGEVLVEATACCVSPPRILNQAPQPKLKLPGGTLISNAGALGFAVIRGAALENRGTVRAQTGTLQIDFPSYTQKGGRTVLAVGTIASTQPVVLGGGVLRGTGRIDAPLTNQKGIVAPGIAIRPTSPASIGTIRVLGRYVQMRAGRLQVDVRGTTPGTGHDRLEVVEAATLDGTLSVRAHRFVPAAADRLKIVTARSRERGFRKIVPAALPGARAYFAAYTATDVDLRTMTSFRGLDQPHAGGAGASVPDTTIAVTNGHVIEATNRAVRLMTRSGNTEGAASLKSFFAAPEANADLFDPKVVFDRSGPNRRVYLIALQDDVSRQISRIWLAVSRSSDPSGLGQNDWCRYPIDAKSSAPKPGSADYPGIAVGETTVVVTTNQVTFSAPYQFTHAEVRVLKKAPLANNAAGACPLLLYDVLRAPDYDLNAFALAPVQPLAPSSSTVYLLSADAAPSNRYRVWRVSDVSPTPTLSFVGVGGSHTFNVPPPSPQPRGGTLEGAGTIITQAVSLRNTIWGVHATECNIAGGHPESCVRAVQIEVAAPSGSGAPTATIRQEIDIGEAGEFYTFPGVAVNNAGQTAVVFQASGASVALSAWWTMKDPAQTTFQPPNRLSSGNCSRPGPSYGDYTGAQTDVDNTGFWLAAERAIKLAGTCQWDTQVGGFTP